MKYIKLTIILLVVAGAMAGIMTLITKEKVNHSVTPKGPDVKSKTIEKRIQDKIESASNSSFCADAYDDILNSIEYFFAEEPSNKSTYTLMLQGAYCRKFVQQANYVFNRNTWNESSIKTIGKEMNKCLGFFPEDPSLDSIRTILQDNDMLVNFNNEVANACQQHPKCINNPLYLYQSDDWDVARTTQLLNNIPNPIGKVRNAPIYQQTRKDKVRERLKNAHSNFIEQKISRSKVEAESYNHNPARLGDYSLLGEHLYDCFNSYINLWNEWNETNEQWQKEVENWGKYVEPLEDEYYQ